jgi:hypothetical protein
MNRVRQIPEAPSIPLSDGKHIGIWGEPDWGWRKLPYAMLAAMPLISEVKIHVHNVSPRALELAQLLKIDIDGSTEPIQQSRMKNFLEKMHLNLYITLSECAPMLPLESLSVGVPCLFSPTSHYFKDHEFLYHRLIVPYPEDTDCIANYVTQAIEDRDEIIDAYRKYAPSYNKRSIKS